uniref:Uncharacterized protein n=1 Tax=Panagrolaimus davidi TaxID=227884 RepID=A0A914PWH0_9BILA
MFECIIGGLCCIGCVGCIGCCFCMKKKGKRSEKVLERISEIYKSDPSGCRSLQAHFRNEEETSEDVLYLYKRLKKDAVSFFLK